MNIILPTPAELKEFQIKHYTKLMEHPRSFEHKIFIRKQIYHLKKSMNGNGNDQNYTANNRGFRGNNGNGGDSPLPVPIQEPYN